MSLAIVGLALVCPAEVDGISHLGWRLSLWALVGVTALLGPLGSDRRSHVARGVTVVVLLVAIGWIGTGMRAFDREARSFDAVLADMADDKTLHPLFFDFRGETGPSRDQVFSYLHFGAWYYVEKGGLYAGMFRFAPRHLPIVRATPLAGSEWREDFTYWSESDFDLDVEGGYDYYLLRQRDPALARGFLDRHDGLVEISNSGPWHLLEPVAAADGPRP